MSAAMAKLCDGKSCHYSYMWLREKPLEVHSGLQPLPAPA